MDTRSPNQTLEELQEIRRLMERSSRFLSLSGISGIWAGTSALIGAAVAFYYFDLVPFGSKFMAYQQALENPKWGIDPETFFFLDAAIILFVALCGSLFFTYRKAKQAGQPIWSNIALRTAQALLIPVAVGGLCSLIFLYRGYYSLIAPIMLLTYGLGIISAAKHTHREVNWLGAGQLVLGAVGLLVPGIGLELWAIGFGLLHVVYGFIHYNTYERAA
jgi:hypothetical protein